jgi:hypothetical protein
MQRVLLLTPLPHLMGTLKGIERMIQTIVYYLIAINIVTFFVYGIDNWKAKRALELSAPINMEHKNLLLRQTLGMGCKQRSVKNLAQQMGTTQKTIQKQLVEIVEKLRHHDDSIGLWKYLNI